MPFTPVSHTTMAQYTSGQDTAEGGNLNKIDTKTQICRDIDRIRTKLSDLQGEPMTAEHIDLWDDLDGWTRAALEWTDRVDEATEPTEANNFAQRRELIQHATAAEELRHFLEESQKRVGDATELATSVWWYGASLQRAPVAAGGGGDDVEGLAGNVELVDLTNDDSDEEMVDADDGSSTSSTDSDDSDYEP